MTRWTPWIAYASPNPVSTFFCGEGAAWHQPLTSWRIQMIQPLPNHGMLRDFQWSIGSQVKSKFSEFAGETLQTVFRGVFDFFVMFFCIQYKEQQLQPNAATIQQNLFQQLLVYDTYDVKMIYSMEYTNCHTSIAVVFPQTVMIMSSKNSAGLSWATSTSNWKAISYEICLVGALRPCRGVTSCGFVLTPLKPGFV